MPDHEAALAAVPRDFLDALEADLEDSRRRAAEAVDRADALRDLRSLALAAFSRLRRPLYGPEDLYVEDDEDTRARVAALVARLRE